MSALAAYYEDQKNYSEAIKWYQQMLEINPNNEAVKKAVAELKGKL